MHRLNTLTLLTMINQPESGQEMKKMRQLLTDVSPHILYEISEKYDISYVDLMQRAGHLVPKKKKAPPNE